ncbi:skin secretory protein xP2-like [Bombina bombina]|uniref:skin secretory protein xP2-like n=1 Tax=Bombina bombina TaxID=8345 RepID=UPI00235B2093|nr:skin secretory protein xP2-like [Bombina bombina]
MASKIPFILVAVILLGHQSLAKKGSNSGSNSGSKSGSNSHSHSSEEDNFLPPAPSGPQDCGVDPYKRRDCGYPGISAAECHKRNCCFDSSIRGVNWCFFSESQESAQCSVDPQDRTDCGYIGISANECYSRGCCFNSSIKGVKWCFYPKPSDPVEDMIDDSTGDDINRSQCLER